MMRSERMRPCAELFSVLLRHCRQALLLLPTAAWADRNFSFYSAVIPRYFWQLQAVWACLIFWPAAMLKSIWSKPSEIKSEPPASDDSQKPLYAALLSLLPAVHWPDAKPPYSLQGPPGFRLWQAVHKELLLPVKDRSWSVSGKLRYWKKCQTDEFLHSWTPQKHYG